SFRNGGLRGACHGARSRDPLANPPYVLSDTPPAIAVTVDERAVAGIEGRRAGAGRARDVFFAHITRRRRRRRGAIGRIDQHIGAVGPRQIAAVLIVVVAARPGLALRGHGSAGACADHRADRRTANTTKRTTDDHASTAA